MPVFNRVWTSPETLPVARGTDRPAPVAGPGRGRGRGPGRRQRLTRRWALLRRSRRSAPAVRRCLGEFAAGDLVLAACSGGADSLALAAALAHEAPRCGLRAGGVTVDHGLQPGSADRRQRGDQGAHRARPGAGGLPAGRRAARSPATAGRKRRRGPPGTRRSPTPRTAPGPPRSCSRTAGTTRRKASCSAWPADPGPGRWRACRSAAGPTGGRCSGSAGPRCGPPARRSACGPGTTRRTPIPPTPGPGYATRHCPPWRPRSAPGWPRPWPAAPASSAPTPNCLTTSPPARPSRCAATTAPGRRTGWPPCRTRSGPGCSGRPPSRQAARPAR